MLVTGASEFLGTAVCAELLARSRPIAALVRTPGSEPPGTVPVVGDLTAVDLTYPGMAPSTP